MDDSAEKAFQEFISSGGEISSASLHPSIPCPKEYKPLIRDKVKRALIFQREWNKVEKVYINRGLPVNRKSLCSDGRKDSFDMRNLRESLPSTSVKEDKNLTWGNKDSFAKMLRHRQRQMLLSIEKFSSMIRTREATGADRFPSAEMEPSCSGLKDEDLTLESEESCLSKFRSNFFTERKSVSVLPKETIKGNEEMNAEVNPVDLSQKTNAKLGFFPGFAQMSFDEDVGENMSRRQNSDGETELLSATTSYPWPSLPYSHLDSRRNSDFALQAVNAPPTARKRTTDLLSEQLSKSTKQLSESTKQLSRLLAKHDAALKALLQFGGKPPSNKAFQDMRDEILKRRKKKGHNSILNLGSELTVWPKQAERGRVMTLHELCKSKALNSRRGVFAEDMDESLKDEIVEFEPFSFDIDKMLRENEERVKSLEAQRSSLFQ